MRSFAKILIGFILVILLISFVAFAFVNVHALTAEEQDKVDKAFEWLDNQVKTTWGSTEQNAFSLLGLSGYSLPGTLNQGVTQLIGLSKDEGKCWPRTGCTIKDTAFAIIALDERNEDTSKAVTWLEAQKEDYKAAGNNWFIQLEIISGDHSGTCTIEYDHNGEKKDSITIGSDRKVTIDDVSTTCFGPIKSSPLDYWVNIKPACLSDPTNEARFYVKCNEDSWIANLLFISDDTPRVFWPYTPISSPSWLEFKSKCFSATEAQDTCNYESTLWASYALSKVGGEFDDTITYLQEDAESHSPISYALLYLTTLDTSFATKLAEEQSGFGKWEGASEYSTEFTTAFGYLASQTAGTAKPEQAKDWLVNHMGSVSSLWKWNNAKDTGAVLWAVFTPGAIPTEPTCTSEGHVCCAPGTEVTPLYSELDDTCRPIGYKCATSCTTPPPDTCVGEGHVCCISGTEIAPLYPEYDDTCAAGQVCASSCTTLTEQCGVDRGVCCLEAYAEGTANSDLDATCANYPAEICAESCQFDFSIVAHPAVPGQIITQGGTADFIVTISLVSGDSEQVDLNVTDFNTDIGTFIFTPDAVFPGTVDPESILRVYTLTTTPNNTYTLNISGTSGDLIHTTNVALTIVIDDSDTTQQCTAFTGYTCCAPSEIRSGAVRYERSCIYEPGTVCVAETDCLEAEADRCGYDRGMCCVTAASSATRYSDLDDTCATGEVCASSCDVISPNPPPICADFVGASCCDINRAGGAIHGQQDCPSGQTCSTSCLTPTVTDTCYDIGGTCCEEVGSDATRYYDYDGTCSYGQYCASQCAGAEEGEGRGGFLTFLLWFLGIILVAAIIIAIYLYIKNKGKKEEKIPGLAGLGAMPPPTRPIPSFKRPEAPRGPPIRPRPLPGAPGRLRPRMRPRPGMPRAPLRPGRPPARKITPIFPAIKPAAKKPVAKKAPGKTRKKAATELEKTLKELAKIQKSKLKTTKKRATRKRK